MEKSRQDELTQYKLNNALTRVEDLEVRMDNVEKSMISNDTKLTHLIASVEEVKTDVKEIKETKSSNISRWIWIIITSATTSIVAWLLTSLI